MIRDEEIDVLVVLRKVDCNDGIAAYLDSIVSSLPARGVRIHIVSGPVYVEGDMSMRRDSIVAGAASWEVIDDLKQIPSLTVLRRLRGIVRGRGIHVISIQGLGMLMWGRLLSVTTGRPFVATYHPSAPREERDTSVASRDFPAARRRYLDVFRPRALIVMSEESRVFLVRQSRRLALRIVRIPGGIDDVHFRPPTAEETAAARRGLGIANGDFVCVLVGRLSWNKGHEILIAAIRRIVSLHPETSVRCLFVGTGEREAEFREMAFVSEDDSRIFRFLGYVKDVREVLWASQVLVLPSRLEGFALVVAEGMATGLVPIRTPSGGAADQIEDGVTGFIIDFEDVGGLTAALERTLDAGARAEISKACVATAKERFSIATMAARTAELYASMLPERATK